VKYDALAALEVLRHEREDKLGMTDRLADLCRIQREGGPTLGIAIRVEGLVQQQHGVA
jgi:hypothetical protein